MKTLTLCVLSALAFAAGGSAYGASNNKNVVTRDYTDTVAPAQQAAYEAGEKAWNECMRQQGFKYNIIALQAETGNDYVYAYEIGWYSWADFDKMQSIEMACDPTVRSQLNPHLKKEASNFFIYKPDMSHMPAGWRDQPEPPLFDVVSYTLKPGRDANEAFTNAVKKITTASDKTKSSVYYETLAVQAGGKGAPDYLVVISRKSWADYGTLVNASIRKMLDSAYGKTKTDAILKSFAGSIAKGSERMWRFNKDLSYSAGK